MRVHLIRSAKSRVIGLMVSWSEGDGMVGVITVPPADNDYWRICDSCGHAEAEVYCRTHFKFFCRGCVPMHDVGRECDLLSRAACRELVARNMAAIEQGRAHGDV